MRAFVVVTMAAVLGALAWGVVAGSRDAPARVMPHGIEVEAAWYTSLPDDPEAATDAFVQRIDPDTRARGEAIEATRYFTLPLRIAILVASVALMLFGGVGARMRALAFRITRIRPLQDALFALQLLAALFLLNLPLQVYTGFVRFRAAGLSDVPFSQWLAATSLDWAVLTIFNIVGVVAIMALIRRRPGSWAGWAMVVYLLVSGSYVLLSPNYIEPLFNEITPLPDSVEKQAVLSLARANGVPAADVFVRDASRQSVLLNAHVSGFGGSATIVLDDNTIANTSPEEIEMVMAHEIGHYVLGHVAKGVLFDSLVMGAGFMLIAVGSRRLIRRYGDRWQVSGPGDVAALPVIWCLFVLWGYLSLPATNGISRMHEAEADLYGLNASRQPVAMAEFMIRDSDTGRLDPSALDEWIFYSHPSPRKRILTAMRWRAEHPEARQAIGKRAPSAGRAGRALDER